MKKTRLIAWAALAALATAAHAGAPMATEDADVLNAGECEWETVAERAKAGGISARGVTTGVQCQALKGTQLGLAYGRGKADGVTVSSLALAGKTALVAREGDGLGLTLAWGLEALKLPGRSGFKHDITALNLVASQGFGAVGVHGNLGWTRSKLADETVRGWALGATYALSDDLELLAETYGAQGAKSSVGLGLRFSAGDWTFGAMAAQDRDTPKTRSLTFSAKLGF